MQHYSLHRGKKAHDEVGILPRFRNVLVHDSYAPYFSYKCEHALCMAHIIRELKKVCETTNYRWPTWFINYFERKYQQVKESDGCLPPDELRSG